MNMVYFSICQWLLMNARDTSLIPGLGRPLVEGHDNPLQYSCLENPMDRGDWWGTVLRVAKSRITTEATEHARTRIMAYCLYFILITE